MTYSEQLKDPRWQKRRLQVMERAGFQCQRCDNARRTLHVHHVNYERGVKPWEYADDNLICVCETCHSAIEQRIGRLRNLAKAKVGSYEDSCVTSLISSFCALPSRRTDILIADLQISVGMLGAAIARESTGHSHEEEFGIRAEKLAEARELVRRFKALGYDLNVRGGKIHYWHYDETPPPEALVAEIWALEPFMLQVLLPTDSLRIVEMMRATLNEIANEIINPEPDPVAPMPDEEGAEE